MRRARSFLPAAASWAAASLVASAALAACGGHSTPSALNAAAPSPTAAGSTSQPSVPTCPLTGLPARKGQQINRPALAVKIDNIPQAMPQAGVENADVVFEELVEGGLTRLMAMFQCDSAATVGPIRSARTSDADMLALLHGSVFAFSGANPRALPPIQAHGDAAMLSFDSTPQYFHRDPSRAAPHDVFSSTTTLLTAGEQRRKGLKAPQPLFHYGPLDRSAKRAHQVSLSWPDAGAAWSWSHGRWIRTQNGLADKVVTGAQLSASDVLVLNITIGSTGLHDVLGNASPLDETTGSGTAWLFRDGKVVKGHWSRPSDKAPLQLKAPGGRPMQLHPGRTWVELLPKGRLPTIG